MKSRFWSLLFIVCAATTVAAGDWPQWRGPNRDNQSTETGLYRTWPAGGPKVLWKTPVAEGYAGVAIKADACTDCGECEPRCPYGLPIVRKLRHAHYKLSGLPVLY